MNYFISSCNTTGICGADIALADYSHRTCHCQPDSEPREKFKADFSRSSLM
jgi:hypothetical protein